jgi:hypothetical protein
MSFQNLKQNPKLAIVTATALLGFILDFLGICIAQSSVPYSAYNAYGLEWYYLFFYLAWLISMLLCQLKLIVQSYRFFLLALTTIGLTYLPDDIDRSLATAFAENAPFGNGLKATGLIIMVFSFLASLVFLGTEPTSPLQTFKFSFSSDSSRDQEKAFQPQSFVPPEPFVPSLDRGRSESTLDNRISAQVAQIPTPVIEMSQRAPTQTITTQPRMTTSPEPVEVKARALYPCISF